MEPTHYLSSERKTSDTNTPLVLLGWRARLLGPWLLSWEELQGLTELTVGRRGEESMATLGEGETPVGTLGELVLVSSNEHSIYDII